MNKIGFIGGGKMASAIIKGIIESGVFSSKEIIASARTNKTLEQLKKEFNINTTLNNKEVVKNSKIIILAVKPFILKDILNEIKEYITNEHLIISIAAGISIKTIEEISGSKLVIRVMPNTPALVNSAMSAICCSSAVNEEQKNCALKIFNSVGETVLSEEKYIDIITAISGSGPAFYYYFINSIAKAGEKLGLDYETSLKLSAQTALGSAQMVLKTGIAPEKLIENVTTKGGCTEAGNNVLIENKISKIIFDTIDKTAKKAYELGKN